MNVVRKLRLQAVLLRGNSHGRSKRNATGKKVESDAYCSQMRYVGINPPQIYGSMDTWDFPTLDYEPKGPVSSNGKCPPGRMIIHDARSYTLRLRSI